MKKFRKGFIPLLVVLVLSIPIMTNAYSGSYSFSINSSIKGTTKHSLANKKTTTTATANTYYTDEVISTKDNFKVYLNKGFSSYDAAEIKANGLPSTKSFGTVKKGSYTVSVYKTTRNTYGATVKGKGTINQ